MHIKKKTVLSISILALGVIFSTGALADRGDGHGKGGRHGMGHALPEFSELDQNGDGQITAEEITAFEEGKFAAIDTNGDGEVSLEELSAKMGEDVATRAQTMFDRFDADNSGGLSEDELPQRGQNDANRAERMVSSLDTDDDGQVSEAEFDAAKSKMTDGPKAQN